MRQQRRFQSVLWLDDCRQPTLLGVDWVKSYDEFVAFLKTHEMPELLCFDHDLSFEHQAIHEDRPGPLIPYDTYKELTGYHAAQYVVENKLPVRYWSVHSMNAQGRRNIEAVMRAYCPQGEVRFLHIPFIPFVREV